MILINAQSPPSNAHFSNLNTNWSEMCKDSSKPSELLFPPESAPSSATSSFGVAVIAENLGVVQNSFSMIASAAAVSPSPSPDQKSGENLLRLLHGVSNQPKPASTTQSHHNFTTSGSSSSSSNRPRPPNHRFRAAPPPTPSYNSSNPRNSIGSLSTSASCHSEELAASQTPATTATQPLSQSRSFSSLPSSQLSASTAPSALLAKHDTKAAAAPASSSSSLSNESIGKLLLEMLKQSSSSSLDVASTAAITTTDESNNDDSFTQQTCWDAAAQQQHQVLPTPIQRHDNIIKGGAADPVAGKSFLANELRRGVSNQSNCSIKSEEQSCEEGCDFVTKNRLFNCSSSGSADAWSMIQQSGQGLPSFDFPFINNTQQQQPRQQSEILTQQQPRQQSEILPSSSKSWSASSSSQNNLYSGSPLLVPTHHQHRSSNNNKQHQQHRAFYHPLKKNNSYEHHYHHHPCRNSSHSPSTFISTSTSTTASSSLFSNSFSGSQQQQQNQYQNQNHQNQNHQNQNHQNQNHQYQNHYYQRASTFSTQTSFSTSCGMAKNFIRSESYNNKIDNMSFDQCWSEKSVNKFANPVYMRSPEPDSIPFPSWERSSLTATAAIV